MKKIVAIFTPLLFVIPGWSQVSFKTIVPQQPVVAGESFQVQYIIEDGEKTMNVKPPAFNNFRFVTGPNIYLGSISTSNGMKPLSNAVYTLEAIRPGKFVIPGATITFNGKTIRSNDAVVQVVSKEEAVRRFNKNSGISNSDYFLRPGEDGYEKIRQNLFVKVSVDKKNCYVGEPVLATFKLYSRLESKSDIVKNPGFYGFTVYDMVNLADKQVATENLNGKIFDVHTIRKVQLYPLQAGIFTIDAMEVKNRVEFSKSAVNKKTEQEIIEGLLGNNDDETPKEGTDVFETTINTEPVVINVKAVPEKNKPIAFAGAAGQFTISASVPKNNLAKNEQGFLDITVAGKGNFIQISAPEVQWPIGVEGFEPIVKDELDKTKSPLTGTRIFRYTFVCATGGVYKLLPVSFSFFNTDSNKYSTTETKNIEVAVSNEGIKKPITTTQKISVAEKSEKAARVAVGIVVLLVLLILLYWIFSKKNTATSIPPSLKPTIPSIDELLSPVQLLVSEDGRQFYTLLHTIIWQFAGEEFDLYGSGRNKQALAVKMNTAGIGSEIINRLFQVLEQCEAGMFTTANLEQDKQGLLTETKKILETIYPSAA